MMIICREYKSVVFIGMVIELYPQWQKEMLKKAPHFISQFDRG